MEPRSHQHDKTLKSIEHWSLANSNIRGVMITGSRASRQGQVDSLSDYDLALIVDDLSFIQTDEWIKTIGPVLVCIHDSFTTSNIEIPTRLTLFEDLTKVDFSFYTPLHFNALFSDKLPDGFDHGYRILIDKDLKLSELPEPTLKAYRIERPTEQAYLNNVNEFWFEVYHVVKYLSRNDLWIAHSRDWDTKELLLQMLAWHNTIMGGQELRIRNDGKGLSTWMDKKLMHRLPDCFGNFNLNSSHQALQKTIELYREIAKTVAQKMSYNYNQKLDVVITKFSKGLIQN